MLFHDFLFKKWSTSKSRIYTVEKDITTDKLEEISLSFAQQLFHSGIRESDRILLCIDNSISAIALQVACSKLGAIYIPCSPNDPKTRTCELIKKYNPVVIIHKGNYVFDNVKNIKLFNEELGVPKVEVNVEFPKVDENSILYIISTSGTTGDPKGIMMSHRAAISFFEAVSGYSKLNCDDNIATMAPFQFDLSLLDLGLAAGTGCSLTILNKELLYKPKKFIYILNDFKVTQLNSVPSIWAILINHVPLEIKKLKFLKTILYAGERFELDNIRFLQKQLPLLKIINCFGQSESIACSFNTIQNPLNKNVKDISFGSGYQKESLFIMDEEGEIITKPNIVGELLVCNASLFEGYWDNKKLTEMKLKEIKINGVMKKVFLSGDMVYKNIENQYYFVSRKDNQIKINGNRVELEEITTCILHNTEFSSVYTFYIKEKKELSVVVEVNNKKYIDVESVVRRICRQFLPLYMIPNKIYCINSLPYTENGKVDKNNLIKKLNIL